MAKRIRAARHYQRSDDPALRLSRSAMGAVARDFRSAFDNLGSMVPVDEVKDALRHGRSPAGLINFHHYREILRAPFNRLAKLRTAGAELGARQINGVFAQARRRVRFGIRKSVKVSQLSVNYRRGLLHHQCAECTMFLGADFQCTVVKGHIEPEAVCDLFEAEVAKDIGNRFNFDALDEDIQQQLRDAQDELIQQLESDARDAIETIIADGTINGTDLSDVADQIKDMIGLTDTQAQAVLNYQSMLEDLDPAALARQLRNKDYDAILQDAIDSGADLSDAAVSSMVDDYIENYLDYRAVTIAATESTRAANIGLHDAYSQAIDRGALTDDAVTRFWQLGDHPCPICESIPDNNPDGVGVNEDFDSDDGPISDAPVHPSCECSVDYVTDLTKVPDDSGEFEFQTQAL